MRKREKKLMRHSDKEIIQRKFIFHAVNQMACFRKCNVVVLLLNAGVLPKKEKKLKGLDGVEALIVVKVTLKTNFNKCSSNNSKNEISLIVLKFLNHSCTKVFCTTPSTKGEGGEPPDLENHTLYKF